MERYRKIIDELCNITNEMQNERLITLARFLRQRIYNPDTFLMFLGETSSGKSTLLNKIIGKDVLPYSAVPLTGSVTEIVFDSSIEKDEFYAINKDATMEVIDKEVFNELSKNADEQLERLRYVTKSEHDIYSGVRLFDTPGYGSLITEHDEVLFEYLHEVDAVAYVVQYRVGFQENDYEFLKELLNLTRVGIPFYLIINRCPTGIDESDRRVVEIYNTVTALLEKTSIPLTLIETYSSDDTNGFCESMNSFMDTVMIELNSPNNQQELKEVFGEYILDLIIQIKAELEKNIRNIVSSKEEKQKLEESVNKFVSDLEYTLNEIVVPGHDKVIKSLPDRIEKSKQNALDSIITSIDNQSSLSKEETVAYVRTHLLDYNIGKEVKELQFYLETEIDAIDKKANDYVNTAIVNFENSLDLTSPDNLYKAGISAMKGFGSNYLGAGLLSYFAKFGGAGGSGAGVANAASHALKKVGDLFGKTFSKETHNSLKHILKVLGLTSTKAISIAAAGIVEVISNIVDISTWKLKLKSEVKKGLRKWAEAFEIESVKCINELKEENIKNFNSIIKAQKEMFSVEEDDIDIPEEQLRKMMDSVQQLEREVA